LRFGDTCQVLVAFSGVLLHTDRLVAPHRTDGSARRRE
jgi:hypothetical protein